MPTISIWYRAEGQKPEVVDTASNLQQANYLLQEYRMAFGPKAVLWAGRKDKEPKNEESKGNYLQLRSYRDVF